jgi:Lrp/AsnC family leucine-responsive transcriptional regulator
MDNLDEKDVAILKMLQEDARHTVKELSTGINLSPSPTFDRQKRLEKLRYIKEYVALVDYKKAGNNLIVLCNIKLKEQKKDVAMQFVERIRQMEEVTECFNTSGDYDYLLKIYLRNMEHYRDFVVNKLATIDSIGNFSSNFVIEEVKYTTHIPIYPKE